MDEGLRATRCVCVCLYVWSPDRCVLFVCLAGSNYMNKKVWCHQHTHLFVLYEQEHNMNSFGVDNGTTAERVYLSVCLFGPVSQQTQQQHCQTGTTTKETERKMKDESPFFFFSLNHRGVSIQPILHHICLLSYEGKSKNKNRNKAESARSYYLIA